jgi:hypothetical protein
VALHRHLASPLLFPDNPVPNQLNASLWSLRYEILCYAMVALVGARVSARWSVVSPAIMGGALVAHALLAGLGANPGGVAMTFARLIAAFFAGSALYALRRRVPFSPLLAAGPPPRLRRGADRRPALRLLAGRTCPPWRAGRPSCCRASAATATSPTASACSPTRSSSGSSRLPERPFHAGVLRGRQRVAAALAGRRLLIGL